MDYIYTREELLKLGVIREVNCMQCNKHIRDTEERHSFGVCEECQEKLSNNEIKPVNQGCSIHWKKKELDKVYEEFKIRCKIHDFRPQVFQYKDYMSLSIANNYITNHAVQLGRGYNDENKFIVGRTEDIEHYHFFETFFRDVILPNDVLCNRYDK